MKKKSNIKKQEIIKRIIIIRMNITDNGFILKYPHLISNILIIIIQLDKYWKLKLFTHKNIC